MRTHDHVVLTLDDGTVVRFNDARRFGLLDYIARGEEGAHPLLAGMGPEPLEPGFDGAYLSAALAGKMTPIKAALLDQRIVAGLGNIYVCEALYRAGISPRRAGRRPSPARGPSGWPRRSATCWRGDRGRRLVIARLRPGRTANSAISSIAGRFTAAKGEPCPGCTCAEGVPPHRAGRPLDILLRQETALTGGPMSDTAWREHCSGRAPRRASASITPQPAEGAERAERRADRRTRERRSTISKATRRSARSC